MTEQQIDEMARAIYVEVYGQIDDKHFKAGKVAEIGDWLIEGDADGMSLAALVGEWQEYDADEIGHRTLETAAATLGRKGGSVTSEAKAAAARENGKRGGRPKKQSK